MSRFDWNSGKRINYVEQRILVGYVRQKGGGLVPESRIRPEAAQKRKLRRLEQVAEIQHDKERVGRPGERRWVPPVFVTVMLLGVAWIVVANVAAANIGFMAAMGNWNILIGMGLIALAFVLMTLWK